jgi:hypothetical protein
MREQSLRQRRVMPPSSDRLLRQDIPSASKRFIPLSAIALDPSHLLLVPQSYSYSNSYSYSVSFPHYGPTLFPHKRSLLPVKKRPTITTIVPGFLGLVRISSVKKRPRPESLYKGDLGIAVLEADLRRPEQAHMPMFERDA